MRLPEAKGLRRLHGRALQCPSSGKSGGFQVCQSLRWSVRAGAPGTSACFGRTADARDARQLQIALFLSFSVARARLVAASASLWQTVWTLIDSVLGNE